MSGGSLSLGGLNKDIRRCFLWCLQVFSSLSLLFNIVFWSAVRIMCFSVRHKSHDRPPLENGWPLALIDQFTIWGVFYPSISRCMRIVLWGTWVSSWMMSCVYCISSWIHFQLVHNSSSPLCCLQYAHQPGIPRLVYHIYRASGGNWLGLRSTSLVLHLQFQLLARFPYPVFWHYDYLFYPSYWIRCSMLPWLKSF